MDVIGEKGEGVRSGVPFVEHPCGPIDEPVPVDVIVEDGACA